MRQPRISALRQMVPLTYHVWGLMRMNRATVGVGRRARTGVSGFWFPSKICETVHDIAWRKGGYFDSGVWGAFRGTSTTTTTTVTGFCFHPEVFLLSSPLTQPLRNVFPICSERQPSQWPHPHPTCQHHCCCHQHHVALWRAAYCFFCPIHAGLPADGVIAKLDFVGVDPVPTTRGVKSNQSVSDTVLSGLTIDPISLRCDPGTTLPPDRVPALQDDTGEECAVEGVHLQPLLLVLILGAPCAVVHVAIRYAWLKKKNMTKRMSELFCALLWQDPMAQDISKNIDWLINCRDIGMCGLLVECVKCVWIFECVECEAYEWWGIKQGF